MTRCPLLCHTAPLIPGPYGVNWLGLASHLLANDSTKPPYQAGSVSPLVVDDSVVVAPPEPFLCHLFHQATNISPVGLLVKKSRLPHAAIPQNRRFSKRTAPMSPSRYPPAGLRSGVMQRWQYTTWLSDRTARDSHENDERIMKTAPSRIWKVCVFYKRIILLAARTSSLRLNQPKQPLLPTRLDALTKPANPIKQSRALPKRGELPN